MKKIGACVAGLLLSSLAHGEVIGQFVSLGTEVTTSGTVNLIGFEITSDFNVSTLDFSNATATDGMAGFRGAFLQNDGTAAVRQTLDLPQTTIPNVGTFVFADTFFRTAIVPPLADVVDTTAELSGLFGTGTATPVVLANVPTIVAVFAVEPTGQMPSFEGGFAVGPDGAFQEAIIPEPASLALLSLAGFAAVAKRRRA